ncbi:MAG: LamG domain-containing protein [Baekduia sp.]
MHLRLVVSLAALLPAAALGMTASAASAAPPLIAQYHMDDTSGADSSGNGLNGTSAAGTSVVAGRFGNALQSSTVPTLVRTLTPLMRPQQTTLLLWFKQSGDPGTLKYLASVGGEGPGECNGSPIAMYTHYQGGKGLTFYVRGLGGGHMAPNAGTAVFDGNWHMAVGTFDGTYARLYVDGQEVGGALPTPDSINYGIDDANEFQVGQYSAQAGCGPSSIFPGAIDEVRMYDRALSAAEIGRMAAATGPQPPDLVPDGGGESPTPVGPSPTPVGPSPIKLGPGQGTNPPRIFSIDANAPIRAGGLTTVKLGVEGASQINWDLSGDGKTDLSCGGNETNLSVRLNSAAALRATGGTGSGRLIKFTTIGGNGVPTLPQSVKLPATSTPTTTPASGRLKTPAEIGLCSATASPGEVADSLFKYLSIGISCNDQRITFGIVEVKGCFVHATSRDQVPARDRPIVDQWIKDGGDPNAPIDVWLTTKPFKVNGMAVVPFGSTSVVFPSLGRIASRSASVKWGPITVRKNGEISLDVRAQPGTSHAPVDTSAGVSGGRAPAVTGSVTLGQTGGMTVDSFDARKSLPSIAGFTLDAQAQLQLWSEGGRHFSEATLHLGLPDVFTAFGGKPPSAGTRISADNDHDVSLDGLDVRVPELELGPVELTDVAFHYNANGHLDAQGRSAEPACDKNYWSATANIYIGEKSSQNGRAGFRLAPDPPQNGVHFCRNGFLAAGGEIVFGGPIPPPTIFPGVTLEAVRLGVQVDPPLVHGGVTMDVAKVARIKGDLLLVLASPSSPYTLTTADAPSFALVNGTKLMAPTVAAGGEVFVKTPLGDLGFGSAHFLYEYPDFVDLGGSVSVAVPGVRVTGTLRGQFRASTGQFNVEGSVRGCLLVDVICGTLAGWVSHRGVTVCAGDIVNDDIVPGVGYGWGNALPNIWIPTGCKPSTYWDHTISAPRAAQAGAPVTFTVKDGETSKSVELIGAGGKAPMVTLTAPDGEKISVGAEKPQFVKTKKLGLLRAAEHGITVAGVLKGKPGTYTITPADGSSPIVKVKETRDDDGKGVTAKVRRAGAGSESYILDYDAGPAGGGKQVTFVEAANAVSHTIKTVKGGKGSIRFTPQAGPGGKRTVVAQTVLAGQPAPDQDVATFTVGDRVSPGALRGLKVKRSGSRLVLSWLAAKNAKHYGITVQAANGQTRTVTVRAPKRTTTIKGISPQFGGSVIVSAEGGLPGVFGKRARGSFKAVTPRVSAFLDYKQLGKQTDPREKKAKKKS